MAVIFVSNPLDKKQVSSLANISLNFLDKQHNRPVCCGHTVVNSITKGATLSNCQHRLYLGMRLLLKYYICSVLPRNSADHIEKYIDSWSKDSYPDLRWDTNNY